MTRIAKEKQQSRFGAFAGAAASLELEPDPKDASEQRNPQDKSGVPPPTRRYLTNEMPLRAQSDMRDLVIPSVIISALIPATGRVGPMRASTTVPGWSNFTADGRSPSSIPMILSGCASSSAPIQGSLLRCASATSSMPILPMRFSSTARISAVSEGFRLAHSSKACPGTRSLTSH